MIYDALVEFRSRSVINDVKSVKFKLVSSYKSDRVTKKMRMRNITVKMKIIMMMTIVNYSKLT